MKQNNIDMLFNYAQKPKIFTPSTASLWDDEHISKGMLEAHLNPEWDAASRKPSFIDKSVEWIINETNIQKGSRILDLGCGPGLYTERFYKKGFHVTGIDFSERSINYAKKQASDHGMDITYIYQDYLTIEFENEFDLVTLIYCDFGVLSDLQRDTLLGKIKKALKPNGKLIFDVFTPLQYKGIKEGNTSWQYNGNAGYWRNNEHICLNSHFIYLDENTHLDQTIVIDDTGNIDVYRMWDHAYTVETISIIMKEFNFNNIKIFADVTGMKYNDQSTTLCVVVEN